MAEQSNAVLDGMVALVEQKAKELADLKRATNVMCRQLKHPEIFAEADEEVGVGMRRVRPDQFYGRTPIVAAREFLELRGEAVRAEEILDALQRGGFDFPSQNWPEKDRLRLLSVSLSKNSVIFHRLPNGSYGLLKWYPDRGEAKEQKAAAGRPKGGKAQAKKAPSARKAQPPARAAKKAARKTSGKRQSEPRKATGRVEVAVGAVLAETKGQFTVDDILKRLEEGLRHRTRTRAELTRLSQQQGSGVRLVKKGDLRSKAPAIYEITGRGGGSGTEGKPPELRIAK